MTGRHTDHLLSHPLMSRRRFCLAAAAQLGCACALPCAALAADGDARRSLPRIACTDWAAAESLAMLGCMPIAVPELQLYRHSMPAPALPSGTADLGARNEPNLEVLSALGPERIFISSWQAGMLPRMRHIAPTDIAVVFDALGDPYGRIRELLVLAGRGCGREALALERLAAFDARMLALRARLDEVRIDRALYVAVLHENGAQAYVYGQGSWVHTVIERLGLHNAWTAPTTFYGNSLVDIAQFAADPSAAILYLDQGSRTRRAEMQLQGSTLWGSLPAVVNGRVSAIPPFYALGGVPSAARCADLVADALASMGKGAGK